MIKILKLATSSVDKDVEATEALAVADRNAKWATTLENLVHVS